MDAVHADYVAGQAAAAEPSVPAALQSIDGFSLFNVKETLRHAIQEVAARALAADPGLKAHLGNRYADSPVTTAAVALLPHLVAYYEVVKKSLRPPFVFDDEKAAGLDSDDDGVASPALAKPPAPAAALDATAGAIPGK